MVIFAAFSVSAAFAGGGQEDVTPTQLNVEPQDPVYLSPGVEDGVQDLFTLPFGNEVAVPSEDLVIVEFRFSVYNASGRVVYEVSAVETERRDFFGNIFGGEKPRVELPEQFEWDGTYNEAFNPDISGAAAGEYVPDGDYNYVLTIADDAGNEVSTPPYRIIIDNEVPVIDSVSFQYEIFSPNNDDRRDEVDVSQEGSREPSWVGTFSNESGEEVYSVTLVDNMTGSVARDQSPRDITWDGTDGQGEVVPDGEYTYVLTGTDRAGNTTSFEAVTVRVSTVDPDVDIQVSGNGLVSPNGDGRQDTIDFAPSISDTESLVSWTAEVTPAGDSGNVLRSFSGTDEVPDSITFDGEDEFSRVIEDGDYEVAIRAEYRDGTTRVSEPSTFTVDTTAPTASLGASIVTTTTATPTAQTIFGGETKPAVDIDFRTDSFDLGWTVAVTSQSGIETEFALADLGLTEDSFPYRWDGTWTQGEVPNDTYSAVAYAFDAAGNRGESNRVTVVKDSRETPVGITLPDQTTFSPGRDGILDTIEIQIDLEVTEPINDQSGLIDDFLFYIRDANNRVVRSRQINTAFESFVWDGRNNANLPVPDGEYTVDLQVVYLNGNRPSAEAGPITVDTTPPSGRISVSEGTIGDRETPSTTVTLTSDADQAWTGVIVYPDGERNEFEAGSTAEGNVTFEWDGRSLDGELLPDGVYEIFAYATDPYGNRGETNRVRIRKLVPPPAGRLTVDRTRFGSPGQEDVTFSLSSEDTEAWTLVVDGEDADAFEVELGSVGAAGSVSYTWDGRAPDGSLLPDGVYEVYAYAVDEYDNRGTTNSTLIRKQIPAPSATLAVGRTLFGGTTKPDVTLTLTSESQQSWTASFEGESGDQFDIELGTVGGGGTVTYVWDGTNAAGNEVPDGIYTIAATATDELGNTGETNVVTVRKETRPTPVSIELSTDTISPGIIGRVGEVRITPIIERPDGVEDFRLEIVGRNGNVVQSRETSRLLNFYDWDGTNAAGRQVADGDYTVRLSLTYANGNEPTATTGPITVDTSLPELSVTITPNLTAFAPNGDGYRERLRVDIEVGLTDGMTDWQLRFIHEDGSVKRTVNGRGLVTERFEWDGRGDNGFITPGNYTAEVEITYRNGESATGTTEESFLLDNEGPDTALTVSPDPFSPDGNGEDDFANIRISSMDRSPIANWSMEIIDPRGEEFMSYSGTGSPRRNITWDGRSEDGELVQSAEDYVINLRVEDELRNVTTTTATVSVDILVVQVGDRLRIRLPNIVFAPNTANLFDVEPDQLRQNLLTLRRLAQILNKYPQYEITVEGHAVRVYWAYPDRGAVEEREVLQPLSEDRAAEVRRALIILGVSGERMSAIGKGGTEPVVPHGNLEERWQNRRVEFWLDREN